VIDPQFIKQKRTSLSLKTTQKMNLQSLLLYFLSVLFAAITACDKNGVTVPVPEMVTFTVSQVEPEAALCGGKVVSDGGDLILRKGVCWSTSPAPTVANGFTDEGMGANTYTSRMKGLKSGTTYYVRAWAENRHGIGYGNEISFRTSPKFIKDIDGNTYSVKTYGDQVWTTENLRVTRLNDGTPVSKINTNTQWFQAADPAYCYYNKDEGYHKNTYGALYNWASVRTARLCPSGWRVPSDGDWIALEVFLGMRGEELYLSDWRGENENIGGKLKDDSLSLWLSPNMGADNSSGFNALPSGYRDHVGSFMNVGAYARWWSTTQTDSVLAISRRLSHLRSTIYRGQSLKRHGYAVRCIKERI
jgi:uncharacterized protein (TIGR02145 family)